MYRLVALYDSRTMYDIAAEWTYHLNFLERQSFDPPENNGGVVPRSSNDVLKAQPFGSSGNPKLELKLIIHQKYLFGMK